ncbi:hypothetical protein TNCV_1634851 [Trichonephila clavipes]|nr:hypothetical protein TNCV_1634851 [Trichonephila clavipes]
MYKGVQLPNIMPSQTEISLPSNPSISLYVGGMKVNSTFSQDEDSTRITLSAQLQSPKQTEKPLSVYVIVRLISSSDPMEMSLLCGGFG